jgi:hypothetical protein
MGDRADMLADRFSQLSQEFIELIESFTPAQMQARCDAEQCTVAALGSHVAGIYRLTAGWIQTAASGQPLPPVTMEMVDQANAIQFARDADRPKGEVLEELRRDSAHASRLVRGLTDDELDRTSFLTLFGREVTTEDLVRDILIADVDTHLRSIRQLTSVPAGAS